MFRIFFHSPCFDGVASAVLAVDFLEARAGWANPELHPVNYEVRSSWLRTSLGGSVAVVDFLYHPDASFWADHHATTFLDPKARDRLEDLRPPYCIFDPLAGSCAKLLWDRLHSEYRHRQARFREMVVWADKIDGARYASVEEAVTSEEPAIRLSLSLAVDGGRELSARLVQWLRTESMEEVASRPEVFARFAQARSMMHEGLARFEKGASLALGDIVVFDFDANGALVNRYAPYLFYPNARYSAGILRYKDCAKVTAMRNPWREFSSAPLGRIAEHLGGGGHHRVASIVVRDHSEAQDVLNKFTEQIRSWEGSR